MLFSWLLFCSASINLISLCYGYKGYSEDAGPYTITDRPSGVFRGSWMRARRGRTFQAYRGIRYAEPPTGELRFQPPQPIYDYHSEVDATAEGPACPQPAPPGSHVDEDCLRLNIYTPYTNSSHKLPVILYMHSGGFYVYSGRSDVYGPRYLMDRDVVLVTINYRLGSLGFLSTGDALAPGNNGFKDQVAALRWVQRNIASFGGDPNLVSIAGCSAGSFSVVLHLVSPMSKGLFHRAIAISGGSIDKAPLRHELRDLAVRQAELLNCPTDNSQVIIHCLKTRSAIDIGNTLAGHFEFGSNQFDFGLDPVAPWQPIVEPDFGQERFLTMQPLDAILLGKFHPVPIIISQTRDEMFWKAFTITENAILLQQMNSNFERIAPIAFMLPKNNSRTAAHLLKQAYLDGREVTNDAVSARRLGRLYGDAVIGFSTHRIANLMCRNSPHPVFYYELDYIGKHSFFQNPVTGEPMGVAHQDDELYLFDVPARFPAIPLGTRDSHMVDKMTAIWYNFVRFGDPNPRGDTPELAALSWPAMTPADRKYLRNGQHFSIHERLFEEWFIVWERLYPIQYSYRQENLPFEFSRLA